MNAGHALYLQDTAPLIQDPGPKWVTASFLLLVVI